MSNYPVTVTIDDGRDSHRTEFSVYRDLYRERGLKGQGLRAYEAATTHGRITFTLPWEGGMPEPTALDITMTALRALENLKNSAPYKPVKPNRHARESLEWRLRA